MPETLTTADLRYQIAFLTGPTVTVAITVADRAAADAICRKHGYQADAHELRMYAAAFSAARRANPDDDRLKDWATFALAAVTADPMTVDGRPATFKDGVWTVDGDLVEEDPTRPGQ